MTRLLLLVLVLAGCDAPEQRELQLTPGCGYDVQYPGLTGCVQTAALCYADLATFCEYDVWACEHWSQWCADEAAACIQQYAGR